MRMITFSKRTAKEIIRDPLNIAFGLGFPLVVLILLSTIQKNIPVSLFEIDSLTPGVAVFGLSFMTLYCIGSKYYLLCCRRSFWVADYNKCFVFNFIYAYHRFVFHFIRPFMRKYF